MTIERTPARTLDDALEDWHVHVDGMWDNEFGPKGWHAVSNSDEGIVAYFEKIEDAFRWRLAMINRDLNP